MDGLSEDFNLVNVQIRQHSANKAFKQVRSKTKSESKSRGGSLPPANLHAMFTQPMRTDAKVTILAAERAPQH